MTTGPGARAQRRPVHRGVQHTLLSTISTLLRQRSGPNVTWKVDRSRE